MTLTAMPVQYSSVSPPPTRHGTAPGSNPQSCPPPLFPVHQPQLRYCWVGCEVQAPAYRSVILSSIVGSCHNHHNHPHHILLLPFLSVAGHHHRFIIARRVLHRCLPFRPALATIASSNENSLARGSDDVAPARHSRTRRSAHNSSRIYRPVYGPSRRLQSHRAMSSSHRW